MRRGLGSLPLKSAAAACTPAKGAKPKGTKLLEAERSGRRPNKPAVTPSRRWRFGAKPKGAKLLKAGRLGRRPNKPAVTPHRRWRFGAKPKGAKLLEAGRSGHRPNKPAATPNRRWRFGAQPKGAKLLKAGRLGRRPNKPAFPRTAVGSSGKSRGGAQKRAQPLSEDSGGPGAFSFLFRRGASSSAGRRGGRGPGSRGSRG